MVNTRQRITNAGHTRREFRQLQQQQRDREESGSGKNIPAHRARQVVDGDGVPYVTNESGGDGPEVPSAYIAFKALLTARLLAGKKDRLCALPRTL